MQRLMLVVLVAASCGGKSKPPTTPLPPDNPPPPTAEAKPKEEPAQPKEPAQPPVPKGPVDVKIPPTTTTVKLVSPGKGKRQALKYTPKASAKQQVEVAMDFTYEQSIAGQSAKRTTPTLVIKGDAETKAVDKDGTAEYALTISGADAKDVAGGVPADAFKAQLGSLTGLVISGNVGANGIAKEVNLHIEKPDQYTLGALDLLRETLPAWPVFPTEPIGVGGKWQATTTIKLAGQVEVSQVTDYELVGHKGTAWTIKGTTKVSGAEQSMNGAKISKIAGAGTSEVTLNDGALYPSTKSTLETKFTATDEKAAKAPPDPNNPASADFSIKVGSAVTAK